MVIMIKIILIILSTAPPLGQTTDPLVSLGIQLFGPFGIGIIPAFLLVAGIIAVGMFIIFLLFARIVTSFFQNLFNTT